MCSICLQVPCDSRCPNAEEEIIYECCKCGYGILPGYEYYDSPDGIVCSYCVENMTVTEFMDLIGEKFSVAEREE